MRVNKLITVNFILFTTINFILFNVSCTTPITEPPTDKRNYNFIILLDLSDRIKIKDQPSRDKELVRLIMGKFENLVKQSQFSKSKDCLQIIVAPQQGMSLDSQLMNTLKIDMSASEKIKDENGDEFSVNTKDGFDLKKAEIIKNIESLYDVAAKTLGADIYSFFKNSLTNTYLKDSNKYYNKLFVLTDGYLAFDNSSSRPKGTYISYVDLKKLRNNKDWVNIFEKGNMRLDSFKDGENRPNYQNLQVMMLEVTPDNPQQYTNELEILKKIWKTWFEDLDIQAPEISQKEPSVNATESKIIEFIDKKPLKEKLKEEIKSDIKFRGDYYSLHLLESQELVKGQKGAYFSVDIRQKEEQNEVSQINTSKYIFAFFQGVISESRLNVSHKKTIYFELGEFEIQFESVELGLSEFSKSVTSVLDKANHKYKIYIKGKADILQFEIPKKQVRYSSQDKYCYLPFDSQNGIFTEPKSCKYFKEQITNEDLPNLRAWFLHEKFMSFYSGGMKYPEPEILEGSVESVVSKSERNATIILFIPS